MNQNGTRYIKSLGEVALKAFLQFTTGSDVIAVTEITVSFKVPMSQNFLSFQVKVHIEKGTSAKKLFDLNKTRFFL